jgi:hypothetical protein
MTENLTKIQSLPGRIILSSVYNPKTVGPEQIQKILNEAMEKIEKDERLVHVEMVSFGDHAACISLYVEKKMK